MWTHACEVGIHLLREDGYHAPGHGAVVGHVVAGHHGEPADTSCPSRYEAAHQSARHGVEGFGAARAEGCDVGLHRSGLEVEPAGVVAAVARFGDSEGHDGHVGRRQVTEDGGDVATDVDGADRADDLGYALRLVSNEQRIQAVLPGGLVGRASRVAGERGDPPCRGVLGVLGVPRLVGAEEVADPEVHDPHGRGRAAVGVPAQVAAGGDRLAHSLNT